MLKIMVFQNADAQDNIMVVIVNKKILVSISNVQMEEHVLKIMEFPNVPVHLASLELIAERKILVTITNAPMVAHVSQIIMTDRYVIVLLASPEIIAKRELRVPVTNVSMVALVLKLTEPRHVTVLKDSQASIVERKMLLKDNVVVEDLVVPVLKVYNVLVKYKRLVAREHVGSQAIIVLMGYLSLNV